MLLRSLLIFCLVSIWISTSRAFFLSWGSSEPAKSAKAWPRTQAYVYQQRVYQPQPHAMPQAMAQTIPQSIPQASNQYAVKSAVDGSGVEVPLPAIPIQVPLQAQMSPTANVHNVQLVPCLCPISTDSEAMLDNSLYTIKQNQ